MVPNPSLLKSPKKFGLLHLAPEYFVDELLDEKILLSPTGIDVYAGPKSNPVAVMAVISTGKC